MDIQSSDDARVQAIARKIVSILKDMFGHPEMLAHHMFDEFHTQCKKEGGWAPSDYYDHEGPQAIALEIEFQNRFGEVASRNPKFLQWRKAYWV